jgi:hypothetical protein
MNLNRRAWGLIEAGAASLLILAPMAAWPHGFAGKRFFPATIGTDDPFVNDEAGLVFGNTWETRLSRVNGPRPSPPLLGSP